MRIKISSLGFVVLSALGACGGSDFDPGAGDDPGTGTSTLTIEGTVAARAQISNALAATDFDTSVSVRVTAGTTTVSTGTVAVTTASGKIQLAFSPDDQRWKGTLPSYEEVFQLDVDSGADYVHGLRIDGPEAFHFTAPTPGATVDSTMQLPIAWSTDSAADAAAIDTDQVQAIAIADTGTYTLAAGSLKTEKDKARTNTLTLTRSNTLVPGGAAGGSQFTISIRNQIDLVAAPAP